MARGCATLRAGRRTDNHPTRGTEVRADVTRSWVGDYRTNSARASEPVAAERRLANRGRRRSRCGTRAVLAPEFSPLLFRNRKSSVRGSCLSNVRGNPRASRGEPLAFLQQAA